MKSIEIIVHAYAISHPHYAALLAYQLSSLELYPSKCKVTITICHTLKDKDVQKTIQYFCANTKLDIRTLSFSEGDTGRRTIGRNVAAKSSGSDIIWFADADYFFGETCLDTLSDITWEDDVSIIFPKRIQISKSHKIGDITINKMLGRPRILNIEPHTFGRNSIRTAIGGLQIIKGDFGRKYGYLDKQEKYHKLFDSPFASTLEDVVFRRFCEKNGKMKSVRLPNLFRFRHTTSAIKTHRIIK